MNSFPDKPATPLIPVLAARVPDPAPGLLFPPIEGGMLQVIDEPNDADGVANQGRDLPIVDAITTAPPAAAPVVANSKVGANVKVRPASAKARRNDSRGTNSLGRAAHAASTLMTLGAAGGVVLTMFGSDAVREWFGAPMLQQMMARAPAPVAAVRDMARAAPEVLPSSPLSAVPPPSEPPVVPQQTAALPASPPPSPPAANSEPLLDATPVSPPATALPDAPTTSATTPNITQAAAPVTRVLPAPTSTQPPVRPANSKPTETVAAPSPMAAEIAHVSQFDALIAPVRDAQVSLADATRLRDAMASTSNLVQTRALRDQLAEPAARTLIDWALARGGSGSAREIKAFAETHPQWPSQDLLNQRAEEQLFVSGGSARDIRAFFDKGAPRTAVGMAAMASAFLAEGDEAQAIALARTAWRRGDLAASLETGFLERFGKLLREEDHKARFDRYMIDNTRWTNDRTDRAAVARRILPHLGEAERKKAEARLAAYLRQPTADALLAALPADAISSPKPDWGLAFQMAQWHRRAARYEAAWKILKDVPTDSAVAGNLDEWWEERRIAAYDALKTGKPKAAYEIVQSPGALSVNPAKDQTFLAGWIALRHLNDATAAEKHFTAFEAVADGPLSRAKAAYWLARTYEAQKAPDKMRAPLERAARNIDTFYGQLARLELDPRETAIKITPPRTPSPEEALRFNNNELVRAAVLSRKSSLENSVTRSLLIRLSQTLATEAEQGLLAHLAEALGDPQMAVRIGKSAVARGHNLLMYAYPINAMPAYQALRPPPEPALILGITRQESEFDTTIVSGAGARGLMQVMTVTAQHVCTDYRIKCEFDRLSRDPPYNAMMASAYIADRMDEFQGSYVLTIAGYNAGPGRARQWIKEFGDPRAPNADPIDWIHRIPFEETREYVQKVLSNMQIYRARLGGPADALRLTADLRRVAIAPSRRAGTPAVTITPAANN